MDRALFRSLVVLAAGMLAGCDGILWNSPYPAAERDANTVYSTFSERPKHLDPVQSYSSNEIVFTAQIYEPPLQYHYLKRPYQLAPAVAQEVPVPKFYDAAGSLLPDGTDRQRVARTVYEVRLRKGVRYQPHPAFARDSDGRYVNQDLAPERIEGMHVLSDFSETGSRDLHARDFEYQIKRLAHPRLHSPIFGLMAEYIDGLKEYAEQLKRVQEDLARSGAKDAWIDLDKYPLPGVEVVDELTYRIVLKGAYPQFIYWLAMPFFAPVPREVDRFYGQPGLARRNITLDWYPVGTGPFMLVENNPNRRMVLVRNPNFRDERYPSEGDPGDEEAGLLRDAGKRLPFIDRAVFSLEKESIPRWNKFQQGYYDNSGISSDTFDQAVQFSAQGAALTEEMQQKGIRLSTSVDVTTMYVGFNMLDQTVGGTSERARKLRQAISIAVDYEEYVSIFLNGRGIPAQGPIAPGIFGYREGQAGMNPVVYRWDGRKAVRRPIEDAKRLLAEAGYPDGIDTATGKPLILNFDTTGGGPEAKSLLEWFVRQFAKINIQLEVRPTDYNRFQDKIRKGNAQIFRWGWHADYPDPENFMFLLHGPQGKVKIQGENAANYESAEFDRLFERMKHMPNSPERLAIIDRMTSVLRDDAPWLFGVHPMDYTLYHAWYYNSKPNKIAYNTLKYIRIDPKVRAARRSEWNQPVLLPLVLGISAVALFCVPVVIGYRARERRSPRAAAPSAGRA